MLNKNLKYVCFDFETTGLDVEKDEAIQIWIVEFNHKFEITDKFSSYIKPANFQQLQNLSEIVEFTTGIKLQQLENAPSFEQIKPEVEKFFDENTILIWHNVDFDIGFLEKYLGEIKYFDKFDTYIFSRLLLHFEPSYALEILADKYWFKWQSHDALEDSIMSMELFKIIIKKVHKLLKKYPFLADVLLKWNSIFSKILELKTTNQKLFSIPKKPINLQKAKKLKTSQNPITTYPNKSVFNVENFSLEEAISFALNNQNKIILAFSSASRSNCAKSVLRQKLIPVSGLNTGFTLDQENEKKLLKKDSLADYESHYILKAFSHYNDELSVFDISNFDEAKIYNFLADKKRGFTSNVVVTTHYELFNHIKENWIEKIKDFTIVFFDWHYWMNSLGKVVNQGFDFYNFINKLEFLKYKLEYEGKSEEIENLINQISTFFGIVWIKLQPFFKGTNNKIELVNMLNEPKNWLNQIKEPFEEINQQVEKIIEKYCTYPEIKPIQTSWWIFKECVQHYCFVEQKVTFGGKLKYIFQPLMENVDINTFNDFMEWTNYYCFTLMNQEKYTKLWEKSYPKKLVDWEKNLNFEKLVEDLKEKIQSWQRIYLISNNKNFSNNLFKLIFNLFKEYDLTWNIYAENITGWQGKLLYYLQKDKGPKITIWWPEFLIQNKAKNVNYTHYYVLSLQGKHKELTMKDLEFYLR